VVRHRLAVLLELVLAQGMVTWVLLVPPHGEVELLSRCHLWDQQIVELVLHRLVGLLDSLPALHLLAVLPESVLALHSLAVLPGWLLALYRLDVLLDSVLAQEAATWVALVQIHCVQVQHLSP